MSQGNRRGGGPPGSYDEGYDPVYYDPPPRRRGEPGADAPTPFGTKIGYAGVGFVLGVLVAPTVRKWIEEARPKVDQLFDRLTGSAEKLAENAADLMASARSRVKGDGNDPDEGGHKH
jgi:hypothetical protein